MGNSFPNLKKMTEYQINKKLSFCISSAQGFRSEQEVRKFLSKKQKGQRKRGYRFI
jgi:hypothetical protein